VDLVAQRAGDRKAGQVLLLRGVTHFIEHSPPRRSARSEAHLGHLTGPAASVAAGRRGTEPPHE
jgi:hypothetical protein